MLLKKKRAVASNAVPIKLVAPSAHSVSVAGTFNGWQPAAMPLRPTPAGEWMGELKLPAGRYEYLFVVDGEWLPDPAAREAVANPFGGMNSVVSVS